MKIADLDLDLKNLTTEDGQTAEYPQEVYTLTQEEERLLCSIFIEEKRIKNGTLYRYQADALNELRFGKSYLEEKYPGLVFTIEKFRRSTAAQPYAELWFTVEDGDDDKTYSVKVTRTEETFTAEDDFLENE